MVREIEFVAQHIKWWWTVIFVMVLKGHSECDMSNESLFRTDELWHTYLLHWKEYERTITRLTSYAAAAKSLHSCRTLCDPIDGSPPGSPIPGILQARTLEWVAISFSMHESEKSKWSRSVMSDPQQPHGLQPTRLLCPWDFPGKSTGMGCHCLLCMNCIVHEILQARIMDWVALTFSKGSSQLSIEPSSPALREYSLPAWATREASKITLISIRWIKWNFLTNKYSNFHATVHGVTKSQTWLSNYHFSLVLIVSPFILKAACIQWEIIWSS